MSERSQNVIRSQHDKAHPFTRVANTILQDERLSFRARGILAFVLSHPDNWTHSAEKLSARSREGRDAVIAALGELKALGYCHKIEDRDAHGHIKSRLVFCESPSPENPAPANTLTDDGIPVVGPTTENQAPVNRPLENRPLENRSPVFQGSLKRISETNVETNERNEEKKSASPLAQSPADATGFEPKTQEEDSFISFPVAAKAGDPREWPLTMSKVSEYRATFPGLDVEGECRKALQWTRDNPTRRKTARGMPKFLFGWLERAQNGGRFPQRGDVIMGAATNGANRFQQKAATTEEHGRGFFADTNYDQ